MYYITTKNKRDKERKQRREGWNERKNAGNKNNKGRVEGKDMSNV
jgi:hypothetical protein